LKKLLPNKESDFFTEHVSCFFEEEYSDPESFERCREWTNSNARWRMFYVVFEMLESSHYELNVGTDSTIFDKVCEVMQALLKGSTDAKNFNLKSILISSLFKTLVIRTLSSGNPKRTASYLAVLAKAIKTNWQNKEETTK
jgi:hypothetical protein